MSDDYLRQQQQQQQQQQHNRQAQQQHRQQRQQQPLPHSSPPPPLSGSPLLPPPPSPQALASPLAAAAAAASAPDFPPRRHQQQQQQVQSEEHERRQQQQQHQHFSGFPLQHTVSGFVIATGLDTGDGQPREDVTGRTSALLSSSCFPSLASVQASLSALPSHGWESALSGRQQRQQQAGLSHQLSSDMQQGSLLGTRVSIPAFGSGRSALAGAGVNMGAIGTGMPGLMHQSPHQSLHYDHLEQHPPVMDELLDQMFSLPSWSDIGGRSTLPWDFNAGGTTTAMDVGSMGPLHGSQKLFTMSLMPPGVMAGSFAGQGMQEGSDNPRAGVEMMHYSTDDTILASRLPQQHGLQDHSGVLAAGPARLQRSPSVGSSGSEGSAGQPHRDQSPPPIAPTWRQPYVGGVPPLPMTLTQNKGEAGNTEALLGKRGREDDEISRDNRSGRDVPQGPFGSFGVAHLGQSPLLRQQSHQQGNPTSQGLASVQAQVYVTQATPAHQGTGPGVLAVARPRVRARRGQATDPHSIAERLRRERIAERMKALQELVPNSNKTDKASMLDEIIDYVKFLQLQVKVLSMSRLGGAGAVAPLVADLPAEGPSSFVAATIGRSGGASGPPSEGLALTERQVARLMEEDMGTAMQYLQSKGLCLMPISLATAISSNGPRPQTAGVQGASGQGLMAVERQRPEQSAVVCSGPPATGSAAADKGRPPRDNRDAGDISGESSKSPKHTADSPRRQ